MNNYSYKKLEEIAKSKGKQLFVETYVIDVKKDDVKINDKSTLVEHSGKSYIAEGTIKNIPFTTYEFNKNDRKYSLPLWESVKKSNKFEGSLCADSHVDDLKVDDILGTWSNMKLGESKGFGDLTLFGENGKKLLALVEYTNKLGVSTVSYGNTDKDGNVLEEDFEYVRTDVVVDPSQEVYIDVRKESSIVIKPNIEESITKTPEPVQIEEKDENEKKSFFEKDTNLLTKETIGNNKSNNKEKKMDKMIEQTIKSDARSLLAKVEDKSNLVENFSQLANFYKDIPEELTETKQDIRIAMSDIKKEILESVARKDKEIQDIQVKYEASCKVIEELKEKYNKACELIDSDESLEESITKKIEAISKIEESLKVKDEEIALLKENETSMLEDIEEFKVHYNETSSLKEDYEDEIEARDLDIAVFKEEREDMLSDIKQFKENYVTRNEKGAKRPNTHRKPIHEQKVRVPIKVDPVIKRLFERERNIHPALDDIKQEVFSSKSLIEASDKIEAFVKDGITDDFVRLKESAQKDPDWLGGMQ